MKTIYKFLILLLLINVSLVSAFVYGPSNLGPLNTYPAPSCYLPVISPNQYDIESYTRCIKDYVEVCDNDIKRIRESAESAIEDAKRQCVNCVDDKTEIKYFWT